MDGKTISSAIVKSADADVHIAFMNMGSESQYVNVQSITCNACKIQDKQVINTIHNMIFKAQESHAKNMYGITQNIFLVNNTINIHIGGGDVDSLSSSSITKDVLAEKFMEASPEFFSRIKFVPEIKKKECVGDMYYCDPATNRWSNCKDLDDFLRKVMPVDEERDVVLAYFAGLLSGRRKDKKFLAFTDKTSGDNGKSTVLALFGSFFDKYGSFDETKLLTKGSFARSCDDHDAGLKSMKGVRLLVSEEMKPGISLDEAFIKRIAGGEGVRIEGRSCGTGNSSDFMWQAGVVLVFNWKSGIADSANPLTEWLEEVVDVTGASSDAVWIGDLKGRWNKSHYGHDTASVFSTKLVKAFFAGKQGTEWKETSQVAISTEEEKKKKVVKRGVIRGIKLVGSS
eukprot:gene6066-biopygen1189